MFYFVFVFFLENQVLNQGMSSLFILAPCSFNFGEHSTDCQQFYVQSGHVSILPHIPSVEVGSCTHHYFGLNLTDLTAGKEAESLSNLFHFFLWVKPGDGVGEGGEGRSFVGPVQKPTTSESNLCQNTQP